VQVGQVTIVAPLNVPSLLGEDTSQLYAMNQYNLLVLMLKDNAVNLDWDDEVLAKTVLTHAGEIKKSRDQGKSQTDQRDQGRQSGQSARESGFSAPLTAN
jgi:NAD(P) transhydrogenase subunit alpha